MAASWRIDRALEAAVNRFVIEAEIAAQEKGCSQIVWVCSGPPWCQGFEAEGNPSGCPWCVHVRVGADGSKMRSDPHHV